MEATVQILQADTPTVNGHIYPEAVVREALNRLGPGPLAIVHVDAFLQNDGAPKVGDALGHADNIRFEEETKMVLAHVRLDRIPENLREGFIFRTAGFGNYDASTKTVTDFNLTSVIVANE